jgi:hypothetical protein
MATFERLDEKQLKTNNERKIQTLKVISNTKKCTETYTKIYLSILHS